jgi:hypothetical protein
MAKRFLCFIVLAALCLIGATELMAQVSSTGQLVGTVTDQTGAVIAGAVVKIKDDATGNVFETKSTADGHFSAASLRPGSYTVSINLQGFKGVEYKNVKVTVGQVYDLSARLEVGAVESTVVVEAGAEVLETVSTTVGSSITGKSITQLPLTSRNALDLAVLMPGASTVGRSRDTSFMGLPKGAINITLDGINSQDNLLKSSDGFFNLIATRTDSIEEFSITTAGQGSEQSGEGGVQIRFETKRGGNVYHGGAWWYHRNDFFNSNYWFSNRDGVVRQRQRLNQYGGQVGGPIWKEKAFFFVSVDLYSNPGSIARTRNILSTDALAGSFNYSVSAIPAALPPWVTCSSSSPRMIPNVTAICKANLVTLASQAFTGFATGFPTGFDPLVMTQLNAVNAVRTAAGAKVGTITNPWLDSVSFNNTVSGRRRFPDVRLDYSITKNIQWTGIYHYNYYISLPDTLNSLDATFPVAPFNKVVGSQLSNRNEWVTAVRWNIGATKSNEVRAGLVTSPVMFFPDLPLSAYPPATTNFATIPMRTTYPLPATLAATTPFMTTPFPAFNTQGRNGGLFQLIETFSWSRGRHNMTFGGTWTRVRLKGFFASRAINTISLGVASSDPASGLMFTNSGASAGGFTTSGGNLPGASTTNLDLARSLYGILLGRVTGYTGTISVDENKRTFVPGAPLMQRTNQHEFGFYGNDSWRAHPQLTVNFGLRWEIQRYGNDPKNIAFRPVGGVSGVFGPSGLNNFYKPGTLTGSATQFELNKSRPWYNIDMNNFAPNVGLAWTPNFSNKLLKSVFGEAGKSVFRGTYSTTYTREGVNTWQTTAFTNPGLDGSIFSNPVAPAAGPCPAAPFTTPTFTSGNFPAGCLTMSGVFSGALQTVNTNPASFQGSAPFQILAFSGQQPAMFDPNLRVPLIHNWSFGIQREISPSIVLEVRYVGNHSVGLWRLDSVNEINIFENGFLQEFTNAKANLAINGGTSFAPGAAGTVPLPIMTQMFSGLPASQGFTSSSFITNLNNNAVGSFAAAVANSSTYLCRLVGSGPLAAGGPNPCPTGASGVGILASTAFPVNFWTANPQATSGAFRQRNAGHSTWNGMTVELRKRYSKGLLFSANYTFAKALTNVWGESSSANINLTTLRDPGYDKGPSAFDLRHDFKINFIYSFPFGPGRRWNSSHGWVNRIVEGWEVSGVNRWRTGRVFRLVSGNNFRTVNAADSGVILNGITPKQLQSSLSVRKLPNGNVYWFPAALIGSTGTSNTTFIAPCNTPGKLCQRLFLAGPSFFRMDLNVVKKIKIYERYELEYRAEFLNAFNNINFLFPGSETNTGGSADITGTTFGQITNSFRDVNSTDDNGGRIIQMVLRVRF